ncbi:MAG TPA: DUF1302 family protein, partial [Vicinamibacteria bacterium]|nr:DUF1302 family protein [Vicinamibacteria bacterium]
SYFRETPTDDRNFYNEGILLVEWARRFAPWVSLKLAGEVRGDTARFAEGVRFEVLDDDLHRSIVNLREAVADFRMGPVELSLGKQFFAWGTADAFNPTDNLNPRDYMDPVDSEKMAVYSVAARLTAGATQVRFVVVPVFTPSRLPLAGTRWLPPPSTGTTTAAAIVDPRDLPDQSFDNVQYGARVKTTLKGWDFAASYFEGFESTPVIRVSEAVLLPGLTVPRATPVFTRMRVLGLDFSTTWRKFEFHGETAFKFVVRDGRHDRFQAIGGFNYTWDDFRLRWLDRILFIAEYSKEVNLSTAEHSGVLGTADLVRFGLAQINTALRDAGIGRVAVKFTEDTELRVSAILDFTSSFSHYVQVKLTHRIIDALQMEAGVDLFTGARGKSFWGQWSDNDRFSFLLRYFF